MVQGVASFKKRWSAIPERMRMNMRAELEDIADDIVAAMFSQAPQLTGDLAGSIQWTWGDAPAGALVLGKVGKNEYGTLRITIFAGGDDEYYARFQEFGTINMPANPFFYPVWRVKRRSVRSKITRAIRKTIRLS